MVRSAAFDPEAWEEAQKVLEEDLPLDPSGLDGEVISEIAKQLSRADWTYREIAAALGVGKSTVGRWLGPGPTSDSAHEPVRGGLVELLLGAVAGALILKSVLGKEPRSGSAGSARRTPPIRSPDSAPDSGSEARGEGW